MKRYLWFLILLIPLSATARDLYLARGAATSPVESHMVVSAELVAIPVSISAEHDSPNERFAAIQNTRRFIASKLKSQGFEVEMGMVSLSSEETSGFISKRYMGTSVDIYAIGSLEKEDTFFSQSEKIYAVLHSLEEPDEVRIRFGSAKLGVENPEKYRAALLEIISSNVEKTKKGLGTGGSVEISGLENPIILQRKNDTEINIYIPHQFTVKW